MKGRLTGYKKTRHIVFRDSLERTPTGEIRVQRMRGLAASLVAEGATS